MERRKRWLISLACGLPLLVLGVVLASMPAAFAEVNEAAVPHEFYGFVDDLEGNPAPAGTTIHAEAALAEDAGKVERPREGNPLTTEQAGEFGGPGVFDDKLLVTGQTGEMYDGMPIAFFVEGQQAEVRECGSTGLWQDSYPWTSNQETCLNMRAGLTTYDLQVTAGSCCPVRVITGTEPVTVTEGISQTFADVGSAQLEAVGSTCCEFVEWTVVEAGETITENPTIIDLRDYGQDIVVEATCEERGPFTLTTNVEPMEGGAVALEPEQPAEGYDCCTTVTATAAAEVGYTFVEWTGDIGDAESISESIAVHIDDNKEITATFEQAEYTLDVSSVGLEGATACASVTVSYDGFSDTVAPGGNMTFTVPGAVTATLEMEGTCCSFEDWIVDGVSQGDQAMISIFMDGDHQVEAVSDPPPFDLSVNVDPMEGGSVTVDPEQMDYACNDVVTVTAVPTTGFVFTGWMGDLTTMNATEQITMTENKEITATFASAEVNLTVTSEGCCSIELTYDAFSDTVEANSTDVFTIERFTEVSLEAMQEGVCSFEGWTLDGEFVEGSLITFAMDDDREAVATCSLTTIYLPIMMKFYP